MCNQTASSLSEYAAQPSVHPTSGSRRVFKQFAWLGVGSGKAALSHPTHQRVTQTVGTPLAQQGKKSHSPKVKYAS